MMDMFLAVMFVCSLAGDCKMFADSTGPSGSVQACRVKLDDMALRVRTTKKEAVTKNLGEFDPNQTFRGLCINPDANAGDEIEKYNLGNK